jgi:hypothetical protein
VKGLTEQQQQQQRRRQRQRPGWSGQDEVALVGSVWACGSEHSWGMRFSNHEPVPAKS